MFTLLWADMFIPYKIVVTVLFMVSDLGSVRLSNGMISLGNYQCLFIVPLLSSLA